jgi:hypothetical protein
MARMPIHRIILFLLFLIPSLNAYPADDYTTYLKATWKDAHRRNPDITSKEVNHFCLSTWQGCHEALYVAEYYNCIVAKECNFKMLDNESGFGYSGALWEVVRRLCRKAGYNPTKYWCRMHPRTVNRILAKQFYILWQDFGPEIAVEIWHKGHYGWREAYDYWSEIKMILRYYDGYNEIRDH